MNRNLYLMLAVLGVVLPVIAFVPFAAEHGLDVGLILQQMFGTPMAAFFSVDVILATLAFLLLVFTEGRRLGMKRLWVYVLRNLGVGVAFALALFLYVREKKLSQQQ